jgi:hypothetical protein
MGSVHAVIDCSLEHPGPLGTGTAAVAPQRDCEPRTPRANIPFNTGAFRRAARRRLSSR